MENEEGKMKKKTEKVPDNHENKVHPERKVMGEVLQFEDLALS